jgi:iron complex transport system permease protein
MMEAKERKSSSSIKEKRSAGSMEKKSSVNSDKKNAVLPILMTCLLSLLALVLSISVGSVRIAPGDMLTVLRCKICGTGLPSSMDPSIVSIFWSIRMPRALTAFLVGGALSLSGAVMQAVLQNPLASSYTLGVSSGASLGAAIIIVTEFTIPYLGNLLLPISGFAFGFLTVLIVLAIAQRMDANLHSSTVILIGMVVSLFVNALLTLVSTFAKSHSQQLLMWQTGSFNGRRWYHVEILFPVCLIGLFLLLFYSRTLDVMSFGDEQAYAIGVNVGQSKKILLIIASFLTGAAVCFSGTIGFVDLIAPHAVRSIFGASHRRVLPMSFLIGGAFLTLCDMVSRTILAPQELPVGAVTAIIGAPFFVWLYVRSGRKGGTP